MSNPTQASAVRLALTPRNWPTAIGLTLLFLLTFSPLTLQRAVAKGFGWLLMRIAGRRRRITEINLDLAFPEHRGRENERRMNAHFESMAFSLVELGMTWWRDIGSLNHRIDIVGLEHLTQAREKGGVLLVSAHFASWELSGSYLGLSLGITASYRPHENALIDHMLRKGRNKHFPRLYAREDIRGMIKELKNGGVLWYASDQNFGHKGSVFVDFFGIPAATNTAASRIARMTGAAVVPFFPIRHDNGRYTLFIGPTLEGYPSDDLAHDARQINEAIEQAVLKAPEQYFWSHRRYKDRPDEGERFY